MMTEKSELIETFTNICKTDSDVLFMKLVEMNNLPEKVMVIIEVCFDTYAPHCLARLLDNLPNYDKFIDRIFIARKESHYNTPKLHKFEESFYKRYQELQKARYKPLDQRNRRQWEI